jgi:hypothetical protein
MIMIDNDDDVIDNTDIQVVDNWSKSSSNATFITNLAKSGGLYMYLYKYTYMHLIFVCLCIITTLFIIIIIIMIIINRIAIVQMLSNKYYSFHQQGCISHPIQFL